MNTQVIARQVLTDTQAITTDNGESLAEEWLASSLLSSGCSGMSFATVATSRSVRVLFSCVRSSKTDHIVPVTRLEDFRALKSSNLEDLGP